MDFNPNVTKGAPAPASYVDASGARYWGAQAQTAQGYGYAVWRQAPNAAPVLVHFAPSGQGQLCLQPSGALEVCAFAAAGDRQAMRTTPVPQWVAAKPASGGTLSARYTQALDRLCAMLGI